MKYYTSDNSTRVLGRVKEAGEYMVEYMGRLDRVLDHVLTPEEYAGEYAGRLDHVLTPVENAGEYAGRLDHVLDRVLSNSA